MTRASLREYATVQRERYLQGTRAEKRQLLDEVVVITGIHRKPAIRLLRHSLTASVPRQDGPARCGGRLRVIATVLDPLRRAGPPRPPGPYTARGRPARLRVVRLSSGSTIEMRHNADDAGGLHPRPGRTSGIPSRSVTWSNRPALHDLDVGPAHADRDGFHDDRPATRVRLRDVFQACGLRLVRFYGNGFHLGSSRFVMNLPGNCVIARWVGGRAR